MISVRSSMAIVAISLISWLLLTIVACQPDSAGSDANDALRAAAAELAVNAMPVASHRGGVMARARAEHISAVQRAASKAYRFEAASSADAAVAVNGAQRWRSVVEGGALQLTALAQPPAWTVELRWAGVGRGGAVEAVAEPVGGLRVENNRASYRRADGSEEWLLNGPLGIEQGFVIAQRPAGSGGALTLSVTVGGSLAASLAADGASVLLRSAAGETRLRYTDLFALDADGSVLPAALAVEAGAILLRIDDGAARYPVTIDPLIWVVNIALAASDPGADDNLGGSVGIDGELVIVGAPGHDDGASSDTGAAYVFSRDEGGPEQWGQLAMLAASDASSNDSFGDRAAISGDVAIVGAYRDNGYDGAAYLFARNQGGPDSWGQLKKLTPSDAPQDAEFGGSVALSGEEAIVGANDADGSVGAAYLFARDQGGPDNWGELKKLTAVDGQPNDYLGGAVAISADVAVVGATGHGNGAAYVFSRDAGGPDNWGQVKKLAAHDPEGTDEFGHSVALSGDLIIVGANEKHNGGFREGAAYVFSRNQGGPDNWGFVAKLTAGDAQDADRFGDSVAISTDYAIVGASSKDGGGGGGGYESTGAVYVFSRDHGGADNWGQTRQLVLNDAQQNEFFGRAAAMSADLAVVGARGRSHNNISRAGVAIILAMRSDDGDLCADGSECAGGHCVDGVCCDTACGGGPDDCQACSVAAGAAADGACGPRTDGSTCQDGEFCNGTESCAGGVCGNPTGDPCLLEIGDADNDCSESCDELAGSCTATDPDGASCHDGLGLCDGGVCLALLGADCVEASECRSQNCVDAVCCAEPDCGAYRCGVDGACGEACSSGADCAAGHECDSVGHCVPLADSGDDGGCGCRLAARGRGLSRWGLLALASLASLGLRRRQRIRAAM